jgi:hypothetical protein
VNAEKVLGVEASFQTRNGLLLHVLLALAHYTSKPSGYGHGGRLFFGERRLATGEKVFSGADMQVAVRGFIHSPRVRRAVLCLWQSGLRPSRPRLTPELQGRDAARYGGLHPTTTTTVRMLRDDQRADNAAGTR